MGKKAGNKRKKDSSATMGKKAGNKRRKVESAETDKIMAMKVPEDSEELDALLKDGRRSGKLVIIEYFYENSHDCFKDKNPDVFPEAANKHPDILFIRVKPSRSLKLRTEEDDISGFPTYRCIKKGKILSDTLFDDVEYEMSPRGVRMKFSLKEVVDDLIELYTNPLADGSSSK